MKLYQNHISHKTGFRVFIPIIITKGETQKEVPYISTYIEVIYSEYSWGGGKMGGFVN